MSLSTIVFYTIFASCLKSRGLSAQSREYWRSSDELRITHWIYSVNLLYPTMSKNRKENVDFVIFMQFLAILPKMPPPTS